MFRLPQLEYKLTELAPLFSEEQMQFHYGKHHATYLENLNKAIEANGALASKTLEALVLENSGPLFNNAAQAWNHTFFWFNLAPKGKGGAPSAELSAALQKSFGGLESMYKQFVDTGVKTFGSGWAWLCAGPEGDLKLVSTSNAEVPFKGSNLRPLLTADVWEHAYYIDYRNRRQAFLEAMKDYLNWNFISENYRNKNVRSLHQSMKG
ncbi:MAG: superoxide dismutase [Fe] [Bdellovibrio sp.]|nr:MAG: superoxide dismutase [Fe] [Bdellovibrio sp.]